MTFFGLVKLNLNNGFKDPTLLRAKRRQRRAKVGASSRVIDAAAERPQPESLVRGVPLFAGLSPDSLSALAAEARPVTFLPGDVVIAEGEHGDALYVVTRGEVTVTRASAGHDEPLATLGHGEVFGEAALLGDDMRNATVTAATPATLLRLTRAQVLALAADRPEIGQRLRAVDAERTP